MILQKTLAILSIVIATLMPTSGFTAEKIQVPGVWGFTPASTQGTYFRELLNQANRDQSKYEFVFDNRPGAGGAIATNYILSHSKTLMILEHSPALFVRAYLYPTTTTYTFNQIKPVMIMTISPAGLLTKNKTLDQLVSQDIISIGDAGAGSSSHLMSEAFSKEVRAKYPNKKIQIVHFPSTNEAYISVLGGHIDACFEFMGDAVSKATKDAMIAGITGKTKIKDYPLLKDQGYPGMVDLVLPFAVFTSADTPPDVINELATILLYAERVESVQQLYRNDYGTKDEYMKTPGDLMPWYNSMITKFKKLTDGIKVD